MLILSEPSWTSTCPGFLTSVVNHPPADHHQIYHPPHYQLTWAMPSTHIYHLSSLPQVWLCDTPRPKTTQNSFFIHSHTFEPPTSRPPPDIFHPKCGHVTTHVQNRPERVFFHTLTHFVLHYCATSGFQ